MGMIFKNVKVLDPRLGGFRKEYIEGPIVITPSKIDIANGKYYIGIQSSSITEGEYPSLYLWLLNSLEYDNDVMIPSDKKDYSELTKLGEHVAATMAVDIYYNDFDKDKYDKVINKEKEFFKKFKIPYTDTYADLYKRDYCNDFSMSIKQSKIKDMIERMGREKLSNVYNILGRFED